MSSMDQRAREPLTLRAGQMLTGKSRWSPLEIVFWLIVVATVFLLPTKHLILTEIAILGLFALSLDLLLGYAGIVSLGHAAFFGFGAYVAGLLAKYGIVKEPVLALLVSGLAAMAFASTPLRAGPWTAIPRANPLPSWKSITTSPAARSWSRRNAWRNPMPNVPIV